MEFFVQLDIILPIVKITTWLISTPNINQSSFGIVVYGVIWTPDLTHVTVQ